MNVSSLNPNGVSEGPIVVKIGGSTLGSHDTTLQDLVRLQQEGRRVVVVHGGGKIISEWMKRHGAMPRFVRGLRVTDAPSLDIVTAVLTGLINKQLVASLTKLGARVIGLSGVDGALLQCRIADPELGFVGEVTQVNPDPITCALEAGFIPLIAPVGLLQGDGQLLNINGDTVTGSVAHALGASNLVFLTDVEGVLDSSGRSMPMISPRQARILIRSNVARGGMIPKLEACLLAMPPVPSAHVIDGRKPGALLQCLSGNFTGTRILAA